MKALRKPKGYHLYLWKMIELPVEFDGWRRKRGRCVASFDNYRDLVLDAQRRTSAAGYPKSRWPNLFTWSI